MSLLGLSETNTIGYYNAGDRMQFWGTLGAFWGWLGGLLVGGALFVIPGLGPVIVLGPLVGGLVGALGGAVVVGGLSALGAGLYSIGIPTDSIVAYETALKSAQFLVMAHGTAEEVATATRILETTGAACIAAHQGVVVAA
jgi:hypothetical protein